MSIINDSTGEKALSHSAENSVRVRAFRDCAGPARPTRIKRTIEGVLPPMNTMFKVCSIRLIVQIGYVRRGSCCTRLAAAGKQTAGKRFVGSRSPGSGLSESKSPGSGLSESRLPESGLSESGLPSCRECRFFGELRLAVMKALSFIVYLANICARI